MTARIAFPAACASLIALIFLCLAWELWLAPLRPGGSWLVLKTLPLLAFVAGCISSEPREPLRAGGSYLEEIKSPMSRQILIDPTCSVR